jgi:hypothetical protein
MPENEQEALPASPRRRSGGTKVLIVALLVLCLIGVIVYLLSVIHSKKYFLTVEGDTLTVKKGIMFVVGSEAYKPEKAEEAPLYAAIALSQGKVDSEEIRRIREAKEKEFDDLASLNHEYGAILVSLAQGLVFSNDRGEFLKGRGFLERAQGLKGLDSKQLDAIKALGADVEYLEAKQAYLGVEETLKKAQKMFEQAETFGTGRFSDAGEGARKIKALLEVVRATKESEGAVKPPTEGVPPEKIVPEKDESAPKDAPGKPPDRPEGT